MKYKREKTEKGGKFKIIHCRTWNKQKKKKSWKIKNIPWRRKNNEITKSVKNKNAH